MIAILKAIGLVIAVFGLFWFIIWCNKEPDE